MKKIKIKKKKKKVKNNKIVRMKKKMKILMKLAMKSPKYRITQQLIKTQAKMKLLLKKSLLEENSMYSNLKEGTNSSKLKMERFILSVKITMVGIARS